MSEGVRGVNDQEGGGGLAALSKEEGTAYFKGRARCKKKSQNWSGLGQGTPLISTALEFAVLLAGFL